MNLAISHPKPISVPPLDEILESEDLRPAFQPIVDLAAPETPFGFEALTRFRGDHPLLDPDFLFLYAARDKRIRDLDTVCLRRSLDSGSSLTETGFLFVNIHPEMLEEPSGWIADIERRAASGMIDPARLVLEITEQGAIDDRRVPIGVFDSLRRLGVRLALDDVGVAHSHLALIDRIRPSFVKISRLFGTAFERDLSKLRIVRNITALGHDFGCAVVLEGIETEATASAAQLLGIEYGQGFWFGRPAEAEERIDGTYGTYGTHGTNGTEAV